MSADAITIADIERLRRVRWPELERVALEAGIALAKVKEAATRDELRQAILLVRSGQ